MVLIPLPDSSASFKQEEEKIGLICQNQINILSEVYQGCKHVATRPATLGSKPPLGEALDPPLGWGREREEGPNQLPGTSLACLNFRVYNPEDLEAHRAQGHALRQ